jgi:hypothetical protein
MPPPSPLRPWEAGDAFLEGMSLMQQYPVEAAGGIDGILQTARDLLSRREVEAEAAQRAATSGIGARIRETVWRGFTNTPASPLPEIEENTTEDEYGEESSEESRQARNPQAPSSAWTAKLGQTVWRGITNQAAMEDVPPSPIMPSTPTSRQSSVSPLASPARSPLASPGQAPGELPTEGSNLHPSSATRVTSLWNYANKLRDSDTAAALAKTSSNLTAKAMDAWTQRSSRAPEVASDSQPTSPTKTIGGLFKRASLGSNGSGSHSRATSVSSGGGSGGAPASSTRPRRARRSSARRATA